MLAAQGVNRGRYTATKKNKKTPEKRGMIKVKVMERVKVNMVSLG